MKKMVFNKHLIASALCVLFLVFSVNAQLEDIQVGETNRQIMSYAPLGIQENSPLLISMHGANMTASQQQSQTKWETIAEKEGFVVVYPQGINNFWDISGTSDTDFILAIIDEMASRYKINRNRVYLSGFSMGGMMTYHAANIISDKIAAFAPVSGYSMGGPNTNSSRPIPIIHVHGTDDDVVSFDGVQTSLDAWIERNECPTIPVITSPYPEDKPNSNGTKYYWGPGKNNVAIVLISLEGYGHWHSNTTAGVHTSQEIWDFCKNYSLDFGTPYFSSAKVTQNNPKQVHAFFSESINDTSNFEGFSVKIDEQLVTIDSISLGDSNMLVITLQDSVNNSETIGLTYMDGNVSSIYNKALKVFADTIVDNLLQGSSPRIEGLSNNEGGDSLYVKLNKKMKFPEDISSLLLSAEYNGNINIPIDRGNFLPNDSTTLVFPLAEKTYADYKLTLSYDGSSFVSSDSGVLKGFTEIPVTNISKGLPVEIETVRIEENGYLLTLKFSKKMTLTKDQISQFVLHVNGDTVPLLNPVLLEDTIVMILEQNMHHGDTAQLSYTPGDITAADKGFLDAFDKISVENTVIEPIWLEVPGKIEAEDFTFQLGIDTEATSDAGGGWHVGYIDAGDWLDFAIDNTSSESDYELIIRTASANNGGLIYYYIDNKKVGQITMNSTGGWGNWKSIADSITVSPGKHYFKIYAAKGGYNINYISIDEFRPSSIENKDHTAEFNVFPNPVAEKLTVQSSNFSFKKIEIIDMLGNTILQFNTNNQTELNLPINLNDGLYMVKISNETLFYLKKIVVRNK